MTFTELFGGGGVVAGKPWLYAYFGQLVSGTNFAVSSQPCYLMGYICADLGPTYGSSQIICKNGSGGARITGAMGNLQSGSNFVANFPTGIYCPNGLYVDYGTGNTGNATVFYTLP